MSNSPWILRLFESEDKPSSRLVLGSLIVVFTLAGEGFHFLSSDFVTSNWFIAGTFFGFGTGQLIATRWAARTPVADTTTIQADKAPVSANQVTVNEAS